MNQKKLETICVYCGSSSGIQPEYVEVAKLLGEVIAIRHLSLVYGGSNIGLMGIVANAVLENGGKVVGVIPNLFAEKITHRELTQIYQVGSIHERKHKMFELSDGFIALPGGLGTVEEIAARLTTALHHIDRDRLIAAPDCGLAMLGRELAMKKLKNLCEAAASV